MKRVLIIMLVLCLLVAGYYIATRTGGGYQVRVLDAQGKPVQGVTVQFCSDTQCILGKTDQNGLAAFDAPSGAYTVHLLQVPDGYAQDDTEYPAPATPKLITLTLRQAVGEQGA